MSTNQTYTGYYTYELTSPDKITVATPRGPVEFSLKELLKVTKAFDVLYYDGVLDVDWCPTFDDDYIKPKKIKDEW